MSPGNSYFKEEVVKQLLQQVVEKYGKTSVLIPDIPAVSTYIALGYPENRARRDKALPQGNALRNKVFRATIGHKYSSEVVKVISWAEDIENNSEYKEKYKKIRNLYDSNEAFREAAHAATKEVLDGGKSIVDMEKAIKIAVHYLLSEFAFMEFAPSYLGAEKVMYIYHRNWPVYERYIAGEFDGASRGYLGFEIVRTDE